MKTPECPIKPLSLDEAISHADEVAGDCSTACKREHKQLADWLRELKSRRSAERGDCAALREVVELVANMNVDGYWNGSASICELVGKAKAALAKPARNCEVGTVEEQFTRFEKFCRKDVLDPFEASAYCAYECPCGREYNCELAWAQMPYEAEKEGGAE